MAFAAFSMSFFSSCDEEAVGPITGVGDSFVKFKYEGSQFKKVQSIAGAQTIRLGMIYREANSDASQAETVAVTLNVDNTKVNAYNAANGTNYVPLDPAAVTIPSTVTLAPGETYGWVDAVFNDANTLDACSAYAMGIGVVVSGGNYLVRSAGMEAIPVFEVQLPSDLVFTPKSEAASFFVGSYSLEMVIDNNGFGTTFLAQTVDVVATAANERGFEVNYLEGLGIGQPNMNFLFQFVEANSTPFVRAGDDMGANLGCGGPGIVLDGSDDQVLCYSGDDSIEIVYKDFALPECGVAIPIDGRIKLTKN